jgi:hypothetical protein
MAWRAKIEKILWYAAVAICSAGALGWLRAIEIWYQYWGLPHSPNPATGNIYPLNIHGYVVYQTLQEQLRRERWEFWSWVIAGVGATLGAIHKLISGDKGVGTG